jgi:galactokinase/mevalonate kinase-like predicted kinase
MPSTTPQTLISLPPAIARYLRAAQGPELEAVPDTLRAPSCFLDSDPANRKLGSGGGTVHLLHQAWKQSASGQSLSDWLADGQRLVLHAGGLSRRLPAYSTVGKAIIPVPLREETPFAKFQQTLCDFQVPLYSRALREAGPQAAVLLASGDVWLDLNPIDIPPVQSSIVGVGMSASPELASHFGVFFVRRQEADRVADHPIAFFLQKPRPEVIYRHLDHYQFYIDTGLWFLSAQAAGRLFDACGWQAESARFRAADGHPDALDFYSDLCVRLGAESPNPAPNWNSHEARVIVLQHADFYHLGTSHQLFESLDQLQTNRARLKKRCYSSFTPQPTPDRLRDRGSLWLDTYLPDVFPDLCGSNVLTTIPREATITRLETGWCVDCTPVDADALFALRPHHLEDTFQGCAAEARLCGQPLAAWLTARGLPVAPTADIVSIPLFPLLPASEITQAWVEWFFSAAPAEALTRRYRELPRLSFADLATRLDCRRYFTMKAAGTCGSLDSVLARLAAGGDPTLFDFDFGHLARLVRTSCPALAPAAFARREAILASVSKPEHAMRYQLFLEQIADMAQPPGAPRLTSGRSDAFAHLAHTVIGIHGRRQGDPRLALKEDQIVWGRSPVRLDLAGGWTDTPPFCFEAGGAVLNVAVNLNGQEPIQVFIRSTPKHTLKINSIDLGISETVETYEQLSSYRDPRSGFSLPKAALSLMGFHPEFGAERSTLGEMLHDFGGGLEISLLCAVPKGSGLGTSSILAATILRALAGACGLSWDRLDVYRKVLALEQMLTTGGGWQDQAGGLFPGLKLVETEPGLSQIPVVRYLPDDLLTEAIGSQTLLLYYTGVTRLAKRILQEIVENMILRDAQTVDLLGYIRANALRLFDAFQRSDANAVQSCIRRSWDLNRALDADTTNPAIDALIDRCGSDLAACKLLGAGGGGFLLMLARDPEAGHRIQQRLNADPPNDRARFVSLSISHQGTQVTRS